MSAAGSIFPITPILDIDEQEIQVTALLPQFGETIQQALFCAIAQFLSSGFQCRGAGVSSSSGMDLHKRAAANIKDLDAAALALAEAIMSEMSEEGWALLREIYATAKRRATEQADIENLDVRFPAEVMGREAAMAGYYEIFPHAKPIEVSVGSDICEDLPGIAPTPEDVLRFSSADFLAVLTATQNQEGDPIHEFEILQNPFGPTAKIPLVYQRRHQRFYELADESRMEEDRF